jgi:Fur family transcriptional regulator, peroxide stress response regulator
VKSPDELTEAFRRRGLKVTPQRQCIFRALAGNPEHPSAESVYESVRAEMPSISLRTVYQTLNDLADMGELSQLTLGPGSARFDPNGEAHQHLVCDGCGKVVDVYADTSGLELAPGDRQGFTVTATQVVFRGTCAQCVAHPPSQGSSNQLSTNQHEETIHA